MKTIKINWGTGIAALYLGFVAMIIVLVIMSTQQKIDLVTDNYYSEELKFQSKIDKKNAAIALTHPISWQVNDTDLTITYPSTFNDPSLSGTINFYCPSDNSKDRIFTVKASGNQQVIPLAQLAPGRYKIELDWRAGSETFWNDGVIVVDKR